MSDEHPVFNPPGSSFDDNPPEPNSPQPDRAQGSSSGQPSVPEVDVISDPNNVPTLVESEISDPSAEPSASTQRHSHPELARGTLSEVPSEPIIQSQEPSAVPFESPSLPSLSSLATAAEAETSATLAAEVALETVEPSVPASPEEPTVSQPQSSTSSSHPSDPTKFAVDPLLLAQIEEFGFDHFIATLAIQRTGGRGVEEAVNWIIDHSNPSDLEESSGSSSDETEQAEQKMGGYGHLAHCLNLFFCF
jgi:hypothetical protein